jgi:hypothetical protein
MSSSQLDGPAFSLSFSVFMLGIALAGTFLGELPRRFGGFAYRTKNPGEYWSCLALYYLCALGFAWYYLYQTHHK